MTTAMIGVSSGNVIWRNFCHGVTPSIAAASYRAGEIVCNPANKVIATKGMPRQMFMAITENRARSDEHTSELQSLMRISYAVLCLRKNRSTENHLRPTHAPTHIL